MRNDPITRVVWRDADELKANSYNPNMVFTPELRLLEASILQQGWIQPVAINPQDVILDGFHRWMLSRTSEKVRARYDGQLPTVVLDLDRAQSMLFTVRINRAKGSHGALKMAELVKELVHDLGLPPQDVAAGIGATMEEVNLLLQESVFKAKNMDGYKFSEAWYPVEDGKKRAV